MLERCQWLENGSSLLRGKQALQKKMKREKAVKQRTFKRKTCLSPHSCVIVNTFSPGRASRHHAQNDTLLWKEQMSKQYVSVWPNIVQGPTEHKSTGITKSKYEYCDKIINGRNDISTFTLSTDLCDAKGQWNTPLTTTLSAQRSKLMWRWENYKVNSPLSRNKEIHTKSFCLFIWCQFQFGCLVKNEKHRIAASWLFTVSRLAACLCSISLLQRETLNGKRVLLTRLYPWRIREVCFLLVAWTH